MSTSAAKVKQFGLTQVYCSPEQPQVDIVFVHGLNGHPYNTWTTESGVFWPSDLLPVVLGSKRVRILTYGYNANVTAFTDGVSKDRIHNHAETLASGLAANRNLRGCSDRPILFVCHSLGGLVVKRTLIYCRNVSNERIEHLRSIFVSTFGILFFGTPHNGSDIAKWGALLHNICTAVMPKKWMDSSPHLVKALKSNNETLQNINSLFADIMPRFHIYLFHETLPTDVKGSREMIVDESSAAPYVEGVERMGIEADHRHMCKFEDDSAPGYEAVAEALMRYAQDSQVVIADRWVEENQTRALLKHYKTKEIIGHDRPTPAETAMGGSEPDLHKIGNPALKQLQLMHYPSSEGRRSPVLDTGGGGNMESSFVSQREPLFVVPPGFHPNATFFGMEKEMNMLHTRVFKAKRRAERLVAVLICGGPGSGKSHLARQYAFSYHSSYPGGIFWVDAKSRESTFKCWWDIAQAALLTDGAEFQNPDSQKPQKYVEAVRNWFQEREDWLLIFDGLSFNEDSDLNHFKQFLPFKKKCSIIYTSVDRTLRKKQRLFEPYCIQVPPLSEDDACKLLFKDLGIKRPTQEQAKKAKDLVNHYECLPLAIHAISHRLSATSKPIERYHIDSHLTDSKLAEPFLIIMNDLYRMEHFEALNLINILSFLGHHVPVGLINLGRASLEHWNVQILTRNQPGESGDIDTTLGILIRYGLIERTSDAYALQGRSFSSSERDEIDVKAVAPDLSESQTESSQDAFFSAYQDSGSIDVIKIHSVVQGFCRDELKIMDEEQNKKPLPASLGKDAGFYDSWLVVASRLLRMSYDNARRRINDSNDGGMVKDYREYETHASRLLENFRKRTSKPLIVREAHEDLRQIMKSISHEIQRVSPGASQDSIRRQRSVFDRSSSSSSSLPDSTTDEKPPRHLHWDLGDMGQATVNSPEEIQLPPPRVNLKPFLPHIFRESSQEKEGGYETDCEVKTARRASPALSHTSHTTVTERAPTPKPASSSGPQDDDLPDDTGWQLVASKQKSTKDKRPKRPKFPRNIRRPKPAAPVLKVFPVEGRSISSSTIEKASRSSSGVSASEALTAAVNQGLSQARSKNQSAARRPSSQDKENVPTYASVAAKRAQDMLAPAKQRSSSTPGGKHRPKFLEVQTKSSLESFHSESSDAQVSPLSPEPKHDRMSRSTYSEPDQGFLTQQLNALDLRTTQMARSRHLSIARPVDMSASTPSVLTYLSPPPPPPPQLPYDKDIEVSVSRRVSTAGQPLPPLSQSKATRTSITHPSAFMPGVSPPPSMAKDAPCGYTSDPAVAPEPMSRGPSGQSQHSWATEPVRFPQTISPMPSNTGPALPTMAQVLPQQQQSLSGAGSWIGETPAGHPQQPMAPPMARPIPHAIQSDAIMATAQAQMRPPPALGMLDDQGMGMGIGMGMGYDHHSAWAPESAPEPPSMLQYGTHRLDVRARQQAAAGYAQYQIQVPPPPHVPTYQMPQANYSGPLIPPHPQGLGIRQAQQAGRRARSGSSPPQPAYGTPRTHFQ